jgi:hypothetical protein
MKVFATDLKPGDRYERFDKILTVKSVEVDPIDGMVTIRTAKGPTETLTTHPHTLVDLIEEAKGCAS